MKKSLFLCGVLFALTTFIACSSDDDSNVAPTLKLSKTTVSLAADGTAQTVDIVTNQTVLAAERPAADTWCNYAVSGNTLTISATANEALTSRHTTITVKAGNGNEAVTENIDVTQAAADAVLTVEGLAEDKTLSFEAGAGSKELTITTNVAEWTASRPEADTWCTLTPAGNKLTVTVEAFNKEELRATTVTVTGGAEPYVFEVKQQGAAPVYSIAIPTDFSKSYVQKVMVEGVKVAEICKEYLRQVDGENTVVDAQMIVAYPVLDGKTDLTKGLVIDNGGSAVWNTSDNTLAYTAGEASAALTTIYLVGETLQATTDKAAVAATVEAELLVDNRVLDRATYPIVKIGTQYWMAENLKARCYSDGSSIANLQSENDWKATTTGAWRGETEEIPTFGRCYNGYAMYDAKGLAPQGWIVPSLAEYEKLLKYLAYFNSKVRLTDGGWAAGTLCTNTTGLGLRACGSYTPGTDETAWGIGSQINLWTTSKEEDWLTREELPIVVTIGSKSYSKLVKYGKAYVHGAYIRCVRK